MHPKTGELITKSIWKLKEKHSFKICPIFHIQPINQTFNPRTYELEQDFLKEVNIKFSGNDKEAVINLSKFIAYQFSKKVDSDNDKDYLFSAYFADKLMNELDDGTIEGILYPSVKEHLSFENVVLKKEVFEKHYILSEVHESIVVKDPSDGHGILLMNGITDCKNFDFNKKEILWSENIMQPKKEIDFYIKEFNIDLS